MSADQFAQLAAGILAICAIVAATALYIQLGLHRPPGTKTRLTSFGTLLTIAVGSAVEFILESQGTETTGRATAGVVRLAIGLALLVFAVAIYRDDIEHEVIGRKPNANNSGL